MFDPIINGIGFGLLLAIMIGPVFFALIQTSLHEGFKAGVHLAAGVFISDTICILIAFFGASQLDLTGKYKVAAGWIGGLLLITFGLFNFFHRIKEKEISDEGKTVHAKFLAKGFFLNTLNPAVLFFWLGVISYLRLKENYTSMHEAMFLGFTLITVFSIDLLKAYVANRIKRFLKPNILLWTNRVVGTALIVFGARMILKVY